MGFWCSNGSTDHEMNLCGQHQPAQHKFSTCTLAKASWRLDLMRTSWFWDPEASKTISAKTHHQNVDYNIFEGMTVTGIPSHTISQGNLVYKQGELQVERGAGRYLHRPPFAPYFDAISKMRESTSPISVNR